MWRFIIIFFFITVWATLARENEPGPKMIAAPECACESAKPDKFEEPLRYGFGAYKGWCSDSCRFRRSSLLKRGGNSQVVSNFQHKQKFWTAEIPLNGVENIDAAFEEFAPKISHVYLRFRFSKNHPVILRSQTDSSAKTVRLKDIVVSPEGSPPREAGYSMINGLMNDYILTFRLISALDIYEWAYVKLKHPTRQHRLNIPEASERRKILEAALDATRTRSFNEVYNLLANNCATSTGDLIYGKGLRPKSIDGALPVDLFFGTLTELKRMGKILSANEGARLPNLEQEM